MMKNFKNSLKKYAKILFPCITVGVIIILWYITALVYKAEIIMPTPHATMVELFTAFSEKQFYISIALTLLRALISFAISYLIAFCFAYFSYKNEFVKHLFYPMTVIARGVPTMSIILICYLMVNPSFSPILIAFIVVFPLSYAEILSYFNSLDNGVIEALKIYGVDNKTTLKEYIMPDILEKSFLSSVNMLAFTVKLVISAEAVLLTANSFGYLMVNAKANLLTGRLFAYTIIAVLLGILFEVLAKFIKNLIGKKRGVV